MSHYPTKQPYMRLGFLMDGTGQFWLGHESRYTPETLEHFARLVEEDRQEWEKKNKHSYKKMTNER